jgi:YD repeat-containing protein
VTRDGAGDVTRIADVRIRRDAAGRALEASIPGSDALVWDRDAAGRVVGVHGPGVALALQRGADGAIRAIRVGERAEATLTRDGAGRVVQADGDVPVTLARDAAGRIVGVERRGSPAMRIDRDARGLPARVTIDGRTWTFGRDGAGRVVRAAGPGGLSLGVARDAAGRVTLLRFPDGTMARVEQRPDGAFAQLQDAGQRLIADARWQLDPVGALLHLRTSDRVGETTWSWRRAPDGTLVALESDRAVWSASPAGIEGPGGSGVTWDGRGRAVTAKTLSNAWGIGAGAIRYERAADGTIVAIAGPLGTARLRHDGVGRLVAVDGPSGSTSILRDALGRLVRAGGVAIEGWEAPLVVGGAPRVTVADAGLAAAGRGIVFDPRGTPILAAPGGVVETAPSGLSVSAVPEGAAGRLQAFAGGPLLALLDAIDPVSGAATAPGVRWPWTGPTWEVSPGESTEADPDATARVPWDPDAWAPDSPWSDPLALLVAIGELPSPGAELRAGDCDGSAARRGVPGVPWLPASLAPELPAPIPDVDALAIDEEPIVRFVLCHALAPTRPADPASLTTALLGERMAREVRLAPDLAPQLPAGLAR